MQIRVRSSSTGRSAKPPAALSHWWAAWVGDRQPAARAWLIEHYAPVVRTTAVRVAAGLPRSVDLGDLVGAGVFGLIDAVERFDPARGVKFETYAVPRIRGAIVDGLRALDWAPRTVRSRARDVEQAQATLAAQLGRMPTADEVSAQLRITDAELRRWQSSIAATTVAPLERLLDSGSEPRPIDGTGPDSPQTMVEESDLRERIRAEIGRLPPRERLVMAWYYDHGLTLAQIGAILGVTESRVSQIHSRVVAVLRERLAAAELA